MAKGCSSTKGQSETLDKTKDSAGESGGVNTKHKSKNKMKWVRVDLTSLEPVMTETTGETDDEDNFWVLEETIKEMDCLATENGTEDDGEWVLLPTEDKDMDNVATNDVQKSITTNMKVGVHPKDKKDTSNDKEDIWEI